MESRGTRSRLALVALLAFSPALGGAEEAEGDAAVIQPGSTVSIEYTLTLEDGEVADTNVGGQPLTFQQGEGQLPPALEAELLGLGAGDSVAVDLSPQQGWGVVREDLFQTVDIEQVPEDARTEGAILIAQGAQGQQRQVRVHEVKEAEVVLDHNHPLAGKKIHFDVKVISVE